MVSDIWDFFLLYLLIALCFFPLFKQTGVRKPSLAICFPTLTTSFFFFLIYIFKKQHFLKNTHAEMTSREPTEILLDAEQVKRTMEK